MAKMVLADLGDATVTQELSARKVLRDVMASMVVTSPLHREEVAGLSAKSSSASVPVLELACSVTRWGEEVITTTKPL